MTIPEVDLLMGAFFATLGVSFSILTWLVLRHSRNTINLTFGFSTVLFAISSFFCALAYSGFQFEVVGFIGNVIMIWAPLGMFLAGKLILDGRLAYKSPLSIVVFIIFLFITVSYGVLYFIDDFQLSRSVFTGALIVSFALILTGYVFGQVYLESADSPELRTKIAFLMAGVAIGISGVISAVLSSNDPFVLPMELASVSGLVINIGLLVTALAFTSIPEKLRSIEPGTVPSPSV
ncbi:MAG: hypothetical protein JSV04_08885 [Candidatus Heimdallarchaeota archaeon]|nr:MAG: hypothetical protein JSV04_08885 [Candidatus Heimdallarchaeota archaeon]